MKNGPLKSRWWLRRLEPNCSSDCGDVFNLNGCFLNLKIELERTVDPSLKLIVFFRAGLEEKLKVTNNNSLHLKIMYATVLTSLAEDLPLQKA